MTLDAYYNASWQYLMEGSIGQATTSMFETAFVNGYIFYLVIFLVFMVFVYIRTQNLGLIGVTAGVVSETLFQVGKFPVYFHVIGYSIIAISFALTVFLFFTEKDYG